MIINNGVLEKVFENDIVNGKITIPEGVTSIGNGAFYGCDSLSEITIPEGVTSIGNGAFYGCDSLSEITIPEGVTSIGNNAFQDCYDLSEITIPKSVTSIGNSAFRGCGSLSEITIPEGVTSIGNNAFYECNSLSEITIPEGVTSIGNNAFYECNSLSEIIIPEGVTSIGNNAFYECNSLSEITIPEGVTSIGNGVFYGCGSLSEITIPKGVTSIGNGAFSYCYNLRQIAIPEGVTSIGADAFSYCRYLSEITIPESVTSIDTNMFKGCSYLIGSIWVKGINISVDRIGNENNHKILLDQERLIGKGYISDKLTQEEKDKKQEEIKNKLENIFNKCKFYLSTNYNMTHEAEYILKMVDIIGFNETEKFMEIPKKLKEEDIQRNSNILSEIYEQKYKITGELPITITTLKNIDTYIAEKNINRQQFYGKLNEKLNNGEETNIVVILQKCAEEIGVKLNENQLQKMQKEIQQKQFTEKENEINEKIKEEVSNPQFDILPRGVTSSLIYNVIRKNILKEGTDKNIEKLLDEELARKKQDTGEQYYEANIIREKNKILEAIKNIYTNNKKLININIADTLKEIKEKIGTGWVRKVLSINDKIDVLGELTEEEKKNIEKYLKESEMPIELLKTKMEFKLKEEIQLSEAYKRLDESNIEDLLTYEKAEIMFSGMKRPYSEKFREWFIKNKEEIMSNDKYYTQIASIHNMFEKILEEPGTNTQYKAGTLSIEGVIRILKGKKTDVRKGNEELGKIIDASGIILTDDEKKELEDIFEVTKKREKSYIPQVKTTKCRYRGRILRADAPMNLLAGYVTNCCQKINGEGEGSMKHGATSKNGRIFLVEEMDDDGNPIKYVAQSWVWRNKDVVCFDNIEIPSSEFSKLKKSTGDYEAQKEILEIYKECANKMLKTDEEKMKYLLDKGKITREMYDELLLKQVVVGTGGNDLGILKKRRFKNSTKRRNSITERKRS